MTAIHGSPQVSRSQSVRAASEGVRGSGWSPVVLAALIAIIVARLHELIPVVARIRPALWIQLAAIPIVFYWLVARGLLKVMVRQGTAQAVVVLAALAVVTAPTGAWTYASVEFLINVFSSILLLYAGTSVAFSQPRFQRMAVLALVFSVIVASLLPYFDWRGWGGRFGIGGTYDENVTAALFVFALPWACAVALTERRWIRILAIAGLPLLLAGVLKTGSRGGMLGMVVLLPWLFHIAPRRRRMLYASGLAVLALGFGIVARDEVAARFRDVIARVDYNFEDREGRLEIWKRGIGYMISRPLQGVGINGFRYQELQTKPNLGFGIRDTAAHNMFVEVGAELGVLGLCAFLIAFASSIRACRRQNKQAQARFQATGDREAARVATYAGAATASLYSLLVTGFFLSLAHSALVYFAWAAATGLGMFSVVTASQPAASPVASPPARRTAGWRSRRQTMRPLGRA